MVLSAFLQPVQGSGVGGWGAATGRRSGSAIGSLPSWCGEVVPARFTFAAPAYSVVVVRLTASAVVAHMPLLAKRHQAPPVGFIALIRAIMDPIDSRRTPWHYHDDGAGLTSCET